MWNSMRVLAAAGPDLDRWTKYDVYAEQEAAPGVRNIVFTGPVPRDACIFFDESLDKYIMYYADDAPRAIQARTSDDAVHWSEPVPVMGIPDPQEAFVTPESPFVIRRDGLYYLFVSGFDYARVALYVSEDPFDFPMGLLFQAIVHFGTFSLEQFALVRWRQTDAAQKTCAARIRRQRQSEK